MMVFHSQSPVLRFAKNLAIASLYGFSSKSDITRISEEIHREWFVGGGYRNVNSFNTEAFKPFTAEAMADGLVQVFEAALKESENAKAN
jgi:hypothetical protein